MVTSSLRCSAATQRDTQVELLPQDSPAIGCGRRKTKNDESTQGQEAVESSALLETSGVQLMLSPGFLPSQEMSELCESPSDSSWGSAAGGMFLPCSGLVLHFVKEPSPTLVLKAFLELFPPISIRILH